MNEKLDYDLRACLEHNVQKEFTADDIESVLAVREGERDGAEWVWVLKLKDKRFALLWGGCDYTGWDCQSSADSEIFKSAQLACKATRNAPEIQSVLLAQLKVGKTKTWQEKKDEEFKDYPRKGAE